MAANRSIVNDEYFAQRTIVNDNGCLLWQGWIKNTGYGEAKVNNRRTTTHRLSWEYHKGPIPSGMCVLHKCDVRNCVNPNHLFLGTTQDNVDDKMLKGRFVPLRGVDNGNAKLTSEQVVAIREDSRPQAAIAAEYGIAQANVSLIKRRLAWAHIATEEGSL
jgi:hypothetical protein